MNLKRQRVEEILKVNELSLTNKVEIKSLLDDGELNPFLESIKTGKVQVICRQVYKKRYLDEVEQFIVNLDHFIYYVNKKFFFLEHAYIIYIIKIILKSPYMKILLNKKFIHADSESYIFYMSEFDKALVDQFYKNLKIMRVYCFSELSKFNINIDSINLTNKNDCKMLYELLSSMLISEYDDLISFVPAFFNEMSIVKSDDLVNYVCDSIVLNWKWALEECSNKLDYIKKIYNIKHLKILNIIYKNRMDMTINKNRTVMLCQLNSIIIDKTSFIIYSYGDKVKNYYLKNIVYPQFDDIMNNFPQTGIQSLNDSKGIIGGFTSNSGIQFSDGTILKNYNEIYPIMDNNNIIGYQLFLTFRKKFNNAERNYINDIIKDFYL